MISGDNFVLTLFTNDPGIARRADAAGIDRIGLDLEVIGKWERQHQGDNWISDHKIEDLVRIRDSVTRGCLFARTNPIHDGSAAEIEQLLEYGVEVLMLPMFKTVPEAATFIDLVNGRAQVSLLVEHAAAAVRMQELLQLPGVDEIHLGLNDLFISLEIDNRWELLAMPFIEMLAEQVVNAGIPLGIGGIGRRYDDHLPIPPDIVYAQYAYLQAGGSIVSRVFLAPDHTKIDITREIALFRERMNYWVTSSEESLRQARRRYCELVRLPH